MVVKGSGQIIGGRIKLSIERRLGLGPGLGRRGGERRVGLRPLGSLAAESIAAYKAENKTDA